MNRPYHYATVKKIERACSLFENKIVDIPFNNFQTIHDKAIGHQEPDIWIGRLTSNFKDLARDIKENPQIRGKLLSSFICGDIDVIKKSYGKIRITEKHFIANLPGVVVNFNGKISCTNKEATNEQLRWLFMPVVYRLLENKSMGKLEKPHR